MNKLFLLFLMLFSTVLWGQEDSKVSTISRKRDRFVLIVNMVDQSLAEDLLLVEDGPIV